MGRDLECVRENRLRAQEAETRRESQTRNNQKGDPAFYAAADTMLLMADRYLHSGTIHSKTHEKLATKYPIG